MRPFTSTIPFPDALKIALDATQPVTRTEHIPITAADGRVAAHDVLSPLEVPPFDRAAMDGYAVRAADVQPGATLTCIGHVFTGEVFSGELRAGECIEIATGAPMPAGADAVVMVEETEPAGANAVRFKAAAKEKQNIGRRGADIGLGMNVVSTGDVLTPSRIGALAATGHRSVEVLARPTVAVLSTGNEVIQCAAIIEETTPACSAFQKCAAQFRVPFENSAGGHARHGAHQFHRITNGVRNGEKIRVPHIAPTDIGL